jgi:phosphopantothenoylcysteine decarboxylase/phosphopantothenate--cysteine ligase
MTDLAGWKVLVTAGGTREPIDPVRYIGNRSSGTMGNAIARNAAARGAAVTLVTTVDPPDLEGEIVRVETAEEMAEAVWTRVGEQDAVVMAAAVADFRPAHTHPTKLSRSDGPPLIVLEPAPDILAGVVERNRGAFIVGFAAETGSLDRAVAKAASKGVDLLVANDVLADGSGFGTVTNQVTVITPDGTMDPWPLVSKAEVASRLWDLVADLRGARG